MPWIITLLVGKLGLIQEVNQTTIAHYRRNSCIGTKAHAIIISHLTASKLKVGHWTGISRKYTETWTRNLIIIVSTGEKRICIQLMQNTHMYYLARWKAVDWGYFNNIEDKTYIFLQHTYIDILHTVAIQSYSIVFVHWLCGLIDCARGEGLRLSRRKLNSRPLFLFYIYQFFLKLTRMKKNLTFHIPK